MNDVISTLEHIAAAFGYQFIGQGRKTWSAIGWSVLWLTAVWTVAYGLAWVVDESFGIDLTLPAFMIGLVLWQGLVLAAVQRVGLWGCGPWALTALVSFPLSFVLSFGLLTLIGWGPSAR
jgi:hypothetical protein